MLNKKKRESVYFSNSLFLSGIQKEVHQLLCFVHGNGVDIVLIPKWECVELWRDLRGY